MRIFQSTFLTIMCLVKICPMKLMELKLTDRNLIQCLISQVLSRNNTTKGDVTNEEINHIYVTKIMGSVGMLKRGKRMDWLQRSLVQFM